MWFAIVTKKMISSYESFQQEKLLGKNAKNMKKGVENNEG